jgi:hypothetical protein
MGHGTSAVPRDSRETPPSLTKGVFLRTRETGAAGCLAGVGADVKLVGVYTGALRKAGVEKKLRGLCRATTLKWGGAPRRRRRFGPLPILSVQIAWRPAPDSPQRPAVAVFHFTSLFCQVD